MRTTIADKEAVIERIEQKAIEVFSSKGFNYTSMQDIADAAGISRGPLYYHYKSKSDLYNHAINVFLKDSEVKYKEIFCNDEQIFIKIYNDLMLCMEGSRHFFARDIDSNKEIVNAKERWDDFSNWLYRLKIDNVLEAINKGEIRKDTDPQVIVDLMYVFYNGISVMASDKTLKAEMEILVDRFVTGLRSTFGTV